MANNIITYIKQDRHMWQEFPDMAELPELGGDSDRTHSHSHCILRLYAG
jgi:hypothetical protein